ncbi:uncharacterized protein Z520_06386 [Fonsecaea multimorphosa CBS 102226]|uniref:Alcohol dehydrogenase-like N-terminal domain-containing protein n=1 Tax=Fonsecaea multimorphosa CBS 102226 TaxID=1442371 RepID=A0A0D2KLP3_9EURO|nr:uncharacterized protein Z520_06386 [Fonsecaea multimorphosa CBS 102226]KIX97608.1 hypothetical protein Z520_06386 [Fonsecaea multimorphosa CBS 102226]OAL24073.1 hypothetical protein AYO22_05954 [Fonsecaea multimorphosa]
MASLAIERGHDINPNGGYATVTGTMRAICCDVGQNVPSMQILEIPEIGHQDVLIRVKSVGLAPGVFKMLKQGLIKPLPFIFGHEVAGLVEAVGKLAYGFRVGQRVRVNSILGCGQCKFCSTDRNQMCQSGGVIGFNQFGPQKTTLYDEYHNGGLADYIKVPFWQVQELPDNVSFDVGAKVHDLANAFRALKVSSLPAGATVVITGATGTMGTATIKLAHFFGISRLILVGRSEKRLDAVRKLAALSIRVDTVPLETLGNDWPANKLLSVRLLELVPQKVDAIIDYWPFGTDIWQTMAVLCVNGTLVHMSGNPAQLPRHMLDITLNCWRIIGTRGNTPSDQKAVLELLGKGLLTVDDLITHRWPLDQAMEAIQNLQDRSMPIWMMVVNP